MHGKFRDGVKVDGAQQHVKCRRRVRDEPEIIDGAFLATQVCDERQRARQWNQEYRGMSPGSATYYNLAFT